MNKTFKVLQIFNKYLEYGGEEGSVERIALRLDKVCILRTYTSSTGELLNTSGGKYRMPFLMQSNTKVLEALRELQRKEGFDVWQIHNVFPGLSVAVYELAVELGVPVIQYLHNYRFGCADATYFREGAKCMECSPTNFLPALKNRCWRGSFIATVSMVCALKRFWNRGGIGGIKAFIAISESQKRRHVEMGISESLIHVIPHSVNSGHTQSCPPENGDVLFLGRLTPEKGLVLLLDAWKLVDSQGRLLRIVGKGELSNKLEEKVLRENISNVVFEGFVAKENHAQLWEKCSFVVAPSIWEEPFGMVVLEAWQHSRPILTTNLGSFPELIEHGVDGWIAEDNPKSFADTLQQAVNCSEYYGAMGEAGRIKLKQKFNEDTWLEKWMELAKKVLVSKA